MFDNYHIDIPRILNYNKQMELKYDKIIQIIN